MRKRLVFGLSSLFLLVGVNPANAMGYILWSAEDGKATNFSQEISIISANPDTLWKAQVRISPEILFGITVIHRTSGIYEAEFGTYFNEGVKPIPAPGSVCAFSAANANQQNFSNCKVSIKLNLPAKIKLSIVQDSTDLTGKTWIGYYSNLSTGETILISKFDVGQSNLNIQNIYEYAYPFGINECQVNPPIQESIWWTPTSTDSKFYFTSTNQSPCGKVTFVAPQNYLKSDGVAISLNTSKSEAKFYGNSINEILYPEVWEKAYTLATKSAQSEAAAAYLSLQSTSEKTISQLQSQISEMNLSIKRLQNQVKKICSAKKKPAGC